MITLFRLCTLFFLACSPHVVGAQPYQSPIGTDSLQAEGLLGSRFGIPGTPTSYDYIVIGGGTAGIVIASRLAENQSATIALVEAGGFYEIDNGNFTQVPGQILRSITAATGPQNPLIDWNQSTTPQPQLGGQILRYPVGKVLGGGSARNFEWYQRSCNGSFSKWADTVSDDSYQPASFFEYLRKSIQFSPPSKVPENRSIEFDANFFNLDGGPLQVSYPSWTNSPSTWYTRAFSDIGLKPVAGFSNGDILGYSYLQYTLTTGQVRSSSESSFLREAFQGPPYLSVYPNTLAKKVTFDSVRKANGVIVETGGATYKLTATKEVIVSAGTFRSPQLLMISGIGPAQTLTANGIQVLADRPGVGQNMIDHVMSGVALAVNLTTHTQLNTDPAFNYKAMDEYNQHATGIYTNTGADLIGFEKLPPGAISNSTASDLGLNPPDWPDIEHILLDVNILSQPTDMRNYITALVALVAPFSRGNVTIVSNDTSTNPVISPNYYSDERDREVALAGFKRVRQIVGTDAMKSITDGDEAAPGPDVQSDKQIMHWILERTLPVDHAACTCAMGNPADPNAVIDSHARVIGVDSLRVVDASSFPFLPPGHPQSTIYALAEKIASDIISGG